MLESRTKFQRAVCLHQLLVFVFIVAGLFTIWTSIEFPTGLVAVESDPATDAPQDPNETSEPALSQQQTFTLMLGPGISQSCVSLDGGPRVCSAFFSAQVLASAGLQLASSNTCFAGLGVATAFVSISLALVILYGLYVLVHGCRNPGFSKFFLCVTVPKSLVVLALLVVSLVVFSERVCSNTFSLVLGDINTSTGPGVGLTAVAVILEFLWFVPFLLYRKDFDNSDYNLDLLPK